MIEYKGYTGVFEFDASIDAFHGRVVGVQDVVTFEGQSVEELRREMATSVDDYLEYCSEIGKEPERPYRGEFLVRTTSEIHRAAAIAAQSSGLSLNAWVESVIVAEVGTVGTGGRGRGRELSGAHQPGSAGVHLREVGTAGGQGPSDGP